MYQTLSTKNGTSSILLESAVCAPLKPHFLMLSPISFSFEVRSEAKYSGKPAPLRMVIYFPNRKKVRISLKIQLVQKQWDSNKQRVKGNSELARFVNGHIEEQRMKVLNLLNDYDQRGIVPDPALFKSDFLNKSSTADFIQFAYQQLENEIGSIEHSTYKKIKGSLSVLKLFRKEIPFSAIDVNLVEDYERFLIRRGSLPATRGNNLSVFRKYCYMAIKRKYLKENPFESFKIKRGQSDRRALTPDQVVTLIKLYFNKATHPVIKHVLQYFLVSCFTSLRFEDVINMKRSAIVSKSLIIKPRKNKRQNKTAVIPLPEVFFKIINPSGPLFDQVYSNKTTNEHLKTVQLMAGIEFPLTYHMSRHTFACLYLFFGGKIEELQVLMCHSDIRTTLEYVHITQAWTSRGMNRFDDFFLDKFNIR